MIPKFTNANQIKRLAKHTDILKIHRALSITSEQYLDTISQGEKTPQYYRTSWHHLHTSTHAPTQIPRVPQPMGTQPVSHPPPVSNLISQPVSQDYGTNLNSVHTINTINSQPTQISQATVQIRGFQTSPTNIKHTLVW